MKFLKIILTMVFVTFLFGCSSKYQSPQNIHTPVEGVTKEQVRKAILATTTKEQSNFGTWKMEPIDKNTIRGHLFNRNYEVVVNIPYSATGYSINYVSVSNNLKNSHGNVHRNYNRWINNLDTK
ncbi:hypothetical protein A9G11_02070, partial [Gilliamella sp. wkB108]|uniref:hypothetical protein n=1 Tax=Gilliamella sp. wkB108 TaxID=3120256 RepID=UPI00080E3B7B